MFTVSVAYEFLSYSKKHEAFIFCTFFALAKEPEMRYDAEKVEEGVYKGDLWL